MARLLAIVVLIILLSACATDLHGRAAFLETSQSCQRQPSGILACMPLGVAARAHADASSGYFVSLPGQPEAALYGELVRQYRAEREPEDEPKITADEERLIREQVAAYHEELVAQHRQVKHRVATALGLSASTLQKRTRREFTKAINALALNIDAEEAERLSRLPEVESVTPIVQVRRHLTEAVPLIRGNQAWELTWDRQNCRGSGSPCLTGAGVVIGVIDSGVDYRHPDLGGCFGAGCKVFGGYDFIDNDANPLDGDGHGTFTAAEAAGKGDYDHDGVWDRGTEYWGVAPDAKILAFRVLGFGGVGLADDVVAAIEASLDPNANGDLSDHADVITISLGLNMPQVSPMGNAIAHAVAAGTLVVASAGNDGPRQASINEPGSLDSVLTVGAVDKWLALDPASSRGPAVWLGNAIVKPDLMAPGRNIVSSQAGSQGHTVMSGTSMSAPLVAGAAALVKQGHPSWTPAQVRAALKATAVPMGQRPIDRGAGLLDAAAAATLIKAPPTAHLQPTPVAATGKIAIKGEISAARLDGYLLAYAPLSSFRDAPYSAVWTPIVEGWLPPSSATLATVDAATMPNGKYALLLRVEDEDAQTVQEYGYLDVDKIQLVLPLFYNVAGGITTVPMRFRDPPDMVSRMQFSYGPGQTPTAWTPISGTTWDVSRLAGTYTLRVLLDMGTGIVDEKRYTFRLG